MLISKKERNELNKARMVIKKVNEDATKKPTTKKAQPKTQDQQPKVQIIVNDESALDKMLEDVNNNDLSNKVIKETDKAIKEADAAAAKPAADTAKSADAKESTTKVATPSTKKRVPFTSVSADADVDDIDDDVPEEYTEDDSAAATTTDSADDKKADNKSDDKEPASQKHTAYSAIAEAYTYAGTDKIKDDMQKAIRDRVISDDLRKCLEILVDNERFRQFILTQCEVKRKEAEPKYVLGHRYVDVDGDGVPDVVIEALGNRDLGLYNIEIKVIRKDIETGDEIGEASEKEAKKYLAELEAKGGKKASAGN